MTQVVELPNTDLFRTLPLAGLPEAGSVDRKAGKILGAKALQIGPLNAGDARPWKVDATSLSQLERFVNQRNIGAKVRFAHPNMSRDGMGRHLGRASNARIVKDAEGDYVAVDLALSEAAKRTPNGDLYSHVLDLAEQTPEDFGLSIAPLLDHEAMSKIEPDEQGLTPIRLKGLRAIDVVDEPAATRGGLFSISDGSLADLPAAATELLDTYFAEASPEVIRARFADFLTTYISHRGDDDMATTATETKQPEAPKLDEQLAAITKERDELKAQLAAKPKEVATDEKALARAELDRVAQIEALCQLGGVDAAKKDLMIKAGFSRQEAQDYLAKSGWLGAKNPPIGEGGTDLGEKKQTPEEKFGAEWEANKEIYTLQMVTKEQYIKSRLKG